MSNNNTQQEGEERDMSVSELNEKTKVPLGIAVTVALAFIGGALWINSNLEDIKHELMDIRREMALRQSREAMEIWIIRFRSENPTIKVPELK